MAKENANTYHRFLDEAGDTTFYLKGRKKAIGTFGVSNCFILGMVKIKDPLDHTRTLIQDLQDRIVKDNYLNVIPSIKKKINSKNGYYLHASDDPPEVRMLFYNLIQQINCSFEAVLLRKSIELYETKHKGNQEEFYADALSHLLKNNLDNLDKLVLNIAERGRSTKNINLNNSLNKAEILFKRKNKGIDLKTKIVFNVKNQIEEPLLNLADYICWSVQRLYEKSEDRYYDYLNDKISIISDNIYIDE